MPNQPYLDKSVHWRLQTGNLAFHELRYREVAQAILDAGMAERVVAKIGSGKEADVFLCADGSRLLVVKAYRYYRTSHRGLRPVRAEELGQVASREFELLGYAFGGGAPVPEPFDREEFMLSMAYVGDEEGPAPRLREAHLERPGELARELLAGIDRLARSGVVHTDLSPFNVLVHRGRPWIIDMADALRVDRLGSSPWERLSAARGALERGLASRQRHFAKYGVDLEEDVRDLGRRIVDRLDRFDLLT